MQDYGKQATPAGWVVLPVLAASFWGSSEALLEGHGAGAFSPHTRPRRHPLEIDAAVITTTHIT